MALTFRRIGDCDEAATLLIEGALDGALARLVYACDTHQETARKAWLEGLTPHSLTLPIGAEPHVCGDIAAFTDEG